jgi:hypothetical protein
MKDRAFKTGSQWIEIFRSVLGVGHREAIEMLRFLESERVLRRRFDGVWGVRYAMTEERAEGVSRRPSA